MSARKEIELLLNNCIKPYNGDDDSLYNIDDVIIRKFQYRDSIFIFSIIIVFLLFFILFKLNY
jgi:hypothetical protein